MEQVGLVAEVAEERGLDDEAIAHRSILLLAYRHRHCRRPTLPLGRSEHPQPFHAPAIRMIVAEAIVLRLMILAQHRLEQ